MPRMKTPFFDFWTRCALYFRGKLHRKWCCGLCENTSISENWDITVVIVVRDMQESLWRAMDSAAIAIDCLLKHAGGPLRAGILVFDDGSRDASRQEARRFADLTPVPMRVVHSRWPLGVSRARNLALAHVNSSWLVFLDADNTLVPEGLARLHALVVDNPDAVLAHGALRTISRQGIMDERMGTERFEFSRGLTEGPLHDITAMYQRSVLLQLGGFDESLLLALWGFEDFDLWMRMGQAGLPMAHQPILIGTVLRSAQGHWARRTARTLGRVQSVFAKRLGPGFTAYAAGQSSDPMGPPKD